MSNVSRRGFISFAALMCGVAPSQFAMAIEQKVFTNGGYAINGYDPVAYLKEGKPVRGNPAIQTEWNGAVWLFSTEENKAAFLSAPEANAPQYGGYCAYAVSRNYTAKTDPEAFTVHKGKLYLNYSPAVASEWKSELEQNIVSGDANWPALAAK